MTIYCSSDIALFLGATLPPVGPHGIPCFDALADILVYTSGGQKLRWYRWFISE